MINGLHMMMNQQMHQITVVSEVVSDLLDFLNKKEEFMGYLKDKQELRAKDAEKVKKLKKEKANVNNEPVSAK